MKVIYQQQSFSEIPQSMAVKQEDDAWHPLRDRNYIEWWYFDLMNSDGSIVRGQFYISGNIARSRSVRTGVRVSYVKPDGQELLIEKKHPFSAFKAATDHCHVQIGNNFIKGDLSHYIVHLEDEEKALELELSSETKGITSRACFGSDSRYMYWVVPQPRCHARGMFRSGGEAFNIDGVGYRDHNWLNFPPLDVLAHWDWGRVYDREFTVIFADIVTTKKFNSTEIKPIIVYHSDKLILLTTESSKWSLTKSDIRPDPETRMKIPHEHIIRAQDGDLSLELNLKLESVFQKIDLLADFNPIMRFLIRTFKAKPYIVSFFSTGKGTLNLAGVQHTLNCTAIHEFVKNI